MNNIDIFETRNYLRVFFIFFKKGGGDVADDNTKKTRNHGKSGAKSGTKSNKKSNTKSNTKQTSILFGEEDNHPYHCMACGKGYMKQENYFNVSPSPYYEKNNAYLPICKRCLEKAFEHYKDDIFDGNANKAMELLCATINTVFDESAWESAKRHPKNGSKVGMYFSKLNLIQSDGRSYADTVLFRIREGKENAMPDWIAKPPAPNPDPPLPPPPPPEPKGSRTDIEIIKRFGLGFDDDDYEALQFEYDDWVSKYGEPEDKRHDELYKNICYLKLHFMHAIQKGDTGVAGLAKEYKASIEAATTELEDRRQKKEDAVKLDPLGVLISDIEKYTPAEYFKDKDLYKDDDGLGAYARRFIFRPLKNLLTGSKDLDKEFSLSDKEG